MSIIYTLIITNSDKIISEYSEYVGNFELISRSLIKTIKTNTRGCLQHDDSYNFFYINNDNLVIICMCEMTYDKKTAYMFLEKIDDLLKKTFTQNEINESISFSLDKKFKPLLNSTMLKYNNNSIDKSDSISLLEKAVLDMKEAVLESCDLTSQRGEKIQIITKKAEKLKDDSSSLLSESIKLRQKNRRRRIQFILLFLGICLVLVYIISIFVCGGFTWKECRNP